MYAFCRISNINDKIPFWHHIVWNENDEVCYYYSSNKPSDYNNIPNNAKIIKGSHDLEGLIEYTLWGNLASQLIHNGYDFIECEKQGLVLKSESAISLTKSY